MIAKTLFFSPPIYGVLATAPHLAPPTNARIWRYAARTHSLTDAHFSGTFGTINVIVFNNKKKGKCRGKQNDLETQRASEKEVNAAELRFLFLPAAGCD